MTLQPHSLHRRRQRVVFDQLVVIGRHQSIEGVAHEAEAEVAATSLHSLHRVDHRGFAMGTLAPEGICGGAVALLRRLIKQSGKRGLN